jgi:hypothetical protein
LRWEGLLPDDITEDRLGEGLGMNAGSSKNLKSTADADEITPEYEGPLVNGRPTLTGAKVQDWCRSAHLPILHDDAALKLAGELNNLEFLRVLWASEFSELRKANPSAQRMRRIANALAILNSDLPALLRDNRAIKPDADLTLTEALLELVRKHQPIVDKHRLTRGRPRELTGNVTANIGKLVVKLCDQGRVTKKSRDAFVSIAMGWLLPNPPADIAISRNRRRRA